MTKMNYKTMSDVDLLAYVKQHPQDNEAFYTFIDRKRANSNTVPMTIEQAEIELERRFAQSK
jgi:hypothetical protein